MLERTSENTYLSSERRETLTIRWLAGILMGGIGISLVLILVSYFIGGSWHLLVAGAAALISVLGLVVVLIRTRPSASAYRPHRMAYVVLGLLMFALWACLLVFNGVSLYLMGGGVIILLFSSVLLLPRRWGAYVVLAVIYLGVAGLIEWLTPLPRSDSLLDSTARFVVPLILALLLAALILLATRSAQAASIRRRLAMSFILVALLPGLLVGSASVLLGLQFSERGLITGLNASSDALQGQILSWVGDLQMDLAVLEALERANLRVMLTLSPEADTFEFFYNVEQPRLKSAIDVRGNFDVLFLADRDGNIVLSTNPVDELLRLTSDADLADVLTEGLRGPYIGPVAASVLLDGPAVTVALPVRGEDGASIGVMVGQTRLDRALTILENSTGLGDTYESYLFDPEGRVLIMVRSLTGGGASYEEVVSSEAIDALLIARAPQSGRYLNYFDAPVLGAYRWLSGLEIGLAIETPQSQLLRTALASVGINVLLIGLSIVAAIVGALYIANGIARPLGDMADVTTQVAEGDLSRTVPVAREDEVGRMAQAFNGMTRRLRELVATLEERVAERTAGLERQSAQLQTAARVAHLAASIHDPDELLRVTASQIGEQFGFYHVGVYLPDDAGRALTLRAAHNGAALLARGFRLALPKASDPMFAEGSGIIVDVARTGRSAIVQDVAHDARYLEIAELPATRSEMSLPLLVRGEVIGVLDVQSTEPGAFSEEESTYLQTLADQVGLAIENARLLSEAQQRLREVGMPGYVQAYSGWRDILADHTDWAYVYDGVEARAANMDQLDLTPDLELPISGSGEEAPDLGVVWVELGEGRDPSPSEEALAQAVVAEASQALDRARLFSGTRRALLETDLLYRCSRAIVQATSSDEVLQALADYVIAPGLDRMILLRHTAVSEDGSDGGATAAMVASIWNDTAEGAGTAGASDLVVGARWTQADLPVLLGSGAAGGPNRAPLVSEDVAATDALDAVSRETLLHAMGLKSVLALHLQSGEQSVGWLLIGSAQAPYPFSHDKVRMYLSLADQVATVVRNFGLLDAAARRSEREQVITRIGDRVRRFTDIGTILQMALQELGRELKASEGVIRLQPVALASHSGAEQGDTGAEDGGNGAGTLEHDPGTPQMEGDDA